MKNPLTSRNLSPARRIAKHPKTSVLILVLWVCVAVLGAFFSRPQSAAFPRAQSENSPSASLADKGKSTVRVCTWNLKNYTISSKKIKGSWREIPKPESEKSEVVKILKSIDADVVLIQEIGDAGFLAELRDALAAVGLRYDYCAITRRNSPMRLGILSRINPLEYYDFSDMPIKVKGEVSHSPRGTLGAKFSTAGVTWYAFAVHLKSKVGAQKSDEMFYPFRFAEVREIDSRISSAAGVNSAILVGGDWNNEPDEALLGNFKTLALGALEQRDSNGDSYSYYWKARNKRFQLDFFAISSRMQKHVAQNAKVYGVNQSASDHSAVYVDIDFSKR